MRLERLHQTLQDNGVAFCVLQVMKPQSTIHINVSILGKEI
jgi:hypothetical protein